MRIKELQSQSNKTIEEVANCLNIPKSTYNKYLQNINEPSIEKLKAMSKFFNVSIDYIVENDVNGKVVYNEKQRQIFKMVTQLNDINTLKAYSYVAGLLAGQG